MRGQCFGPVLLPFSKTVIENNFWKHREKLFLLSKFSIFCVFQNLKKKKKKEEPNVLSLLSLSLFFRTENSFQK